MLAYDAMRATCCLHSYAANCAEALQNYPAPRSTPVPPRVSDESRQPAEGGFVVAQNADSAALVEQPRLLFGEGIGMLAFLVAQVVPISFSQTVKNSESNPSAKVW